MTIYNSSLGSHTTLDFSIPSDFQQPEHNIRIFRFVNNELVIGCVVGHDKVSGSVMVTLPMFVDMNYCEVHDEEESYEFTPYMRNVFPFNVHYPVPIPFTLNHCISVFPPADHMIRNYIRYLMISKEVLEEDFVTARETMH